jgi:leucyl/phenylalanyl-tRNA--protein transferase
MEYLTPDIILYAYRQGAFPMADSARDMAVHFYRPVMRGLLSIPDLHIPKRLKRTVRQYPYRITFNTAFETVIDSCAKETPRRPKTWINAPIRDAFVELHHMGHAHSIECWAEDGAFAGGIYGLAIGRVFCGESMVSTARDASKIALVHLMRAA